MANSDKRKDVPEKKERCGEERECEEKGESRSEEYVRVEEGRKKKRIKGSRAAKSWGSIRNDSWERNIEIRKSKVDTIRTVYRRG